MRAVHQLSAAANAAMLFLIILFASNADVLTLPRQSGRSLSLPIPVSQPTARRVLLVVIDGLRADACADDAFMPELSRLAKGGWRSTATVEAVIPSTVSGIETLVTGTTPPPASFLGDFWAHPAGNGGIFQSLSQTGEKSFVAGPSLWTGRFGRWITASRTSSDLEGEDESSLVAGLTALESGDYRLVVVHFLRTDAAGHAFGSDSARYRSAARWCDEAVGRLALHVHDGDAILVTSDHGMTAGGGHAGREPDVVTTPVVAAGRIAAPAFPLRQADVCGLLSQALGLPATSHRDASPDDRLGVLIGGLLAIALFVPVATSLADGHSGSPQATWLNGVVWITLILLYFGSFRLGVSVALFGLFSASAYSSGKLPRQPSITNRGTYNTSFMIPLVVGMMIGLIRIGDGFWSARHAPETSASILRIGVGLAAVCAAGRVLRRWINVKPSLTGIFVVLGMTLAARVVGQTVSLSSLDTRLAFRVADSPAGLAGAAGMVVLFQSLPALAIGAVIGRGLKGPPLRTTGQFFAGMTLALCGQALVSGIALSAGSLDCQSLALGCLLRVTSELIWLSLALAAAVAVPRFPMPRAFAARSMAKREELSAA